MKRPYIIADVGVNFYDTAKAEGISPLQAAKKYIFEAKNAGIDAVKFQSYKADTIVSKNSPAYWDLSKEPTPTQHELFKKHDGFDQEDYQHLCDYCKERKEFASSTDGVADFEDMASAYKISSSDLNNTLFEAYCKERETDFFIGGCLLPFGNRRSSEGINR